MTTSSPVPWPDDVSSCLHPQCDRQSTAAYCCMSCRLAAERGYAIDETTPLAHSESCDDRYLHWTKLRAKQPPDPEG
jgi:hypothetical protein